MNANLRAALVIARRDYVASVWSRAFVLFLLGPLIPIIFGITFGSVGAKMQQSEPPVIAIIAPPETGQALLEARSSATGSLGDFIPRFTLVEPVGDGARQADRMLAQGEATAVLSGLPHAATLHGSRSALAPYGARIEWLINEVERSRAIEKAGLKPPVVHLAHAPAKDVARPLQADRTVLARAAQLLLLFLTMILSGLLLSNLLEEKSSKVIEILAAAVPVDAIFMGKLIGMLGMSLTGIAIWSLAAFGTVAVVAPDFVLNMVAPAVGWPGFILLCVVYFIASYLLLGALFLGIGGQAASVREVQTLSMPLTFGQLIVFGFATAVIDAPNGLPALLASIFPWSSPYAMIARGALRDEWWPHLLAIAWYVVAVTAIIRIGARMFRRSVLKSGGRGGLRRWLSRRSSRTA
ncbi:MAG: ABC transporter permease [Sphingomonadaceae bacterium]